MMFITMLKTMLGLVHCSWCFEQSTILHHNRDGQFISDLRNIGKSKNKEKWAINYYCSLSKVGRRLFETSDGGPPFIPIKAAQ